MGEPGRTFDDGLFRKLAWLTLFRLVIITVLLGGTAIVTWRTGDQANTGPLYSLVLFTYLVSLGLATALRLRRRLTQLAYVHIALDVALATTVVGITGWAESVFVFLYSLGIVNGSILLYRRGAVASAVLSAAVYLALVLGFAPSSLQPGPLTLFAHVSAFLATAALSGYLAEQLRDTGARLEAREEDLAAITALHESIVQSVASGLLTVDGQGRVTFLNRAGEQITGLGLAEVRGRPAERWFGAFQEAHGRDETDFVAASGEVLRLGYSIFPLKGRGDEVIGRAVIFQDLTRLRAMEARVQRSERLADLGKVAAGLAHELRNPLASMMGSIELLGASAAPDSQDARLLSIVLREAARLDQLVSRFLAFSRPAPPRREESDVARIVDEALDVFANDPAAARVELRRDLAPVAVSCDPDQVRQVVWNLLLNAAQAVAGQDGAPAEGPAGRVEVRCAADAEGARLTVADDGPGIPPENLARLFTPFFTTKPAGTGLGLATVHRIVDAHGGAVSIEPRPGGGTVFTVRLPRRGPEPLLPG
ncbi:two-component system sensor histidine kinase NtrB [Anaeromyxobacter paludicola]|uniref:histidine kinase n=1 Tax=Anaeromyxobacter paludicola TaxID=2918171 RepID=A0ABM7XB11_9BACT|nr:ATP-binding protein [Anaeromyxobacter paludicola]BDG09044.1 PAS domain-containing sensor histidine kinase [Anaeromyxobacter paludicola]